MWYWVDLEPAAAEVARVLHSRDVLGLLWNLRDERVPWMAELRPVLGGEDLHGRPPRVMLPEDAPFIEATSTDFPFAQQLVPEDLVDLVVSRSHVQVLRDDERAALLERVARFARVHPELAGRATIEVPYVTFCWRATRA